VELVGTLVGGGKNRGGEPVAVFLEAGLIFGGRDSNLMEESVTVRENSEKRIDGGEVGTQG